MPKKSTFIAEEFEGLEGIFQIPYTNSRSDTDRQAAVSLKLRGMLRNFAMKQHFTQKLKGE